MLPKRTLQLTCGCYSIFAMQSIHTFKTMASYIIFYTSYIIHHFYILWFFRTSLHFSSKGSRGSCNLSSMSRLHKSHLEVSFTSLDQKFPSMWIQSFLGWFKSAAIKGYWSWAANRTRFTHRWATWRKHRFFTQDFLQNPKLQVKCK